MFGLRGGLDPAEQAVRELLPRQDSNLRHRLRRAAICLDHLSRMAAQRVVFTQP